jgi:ribosomal protein S14
MRKRKDPIRAACQDCGGPYVVYRPQQRFCKGVCRQRFHRKAHAELFARLIREAAAR